MTVASCEKLNFSVDERLLQLISPLSLSLLFHFINVMIQRTGIVQKVNNP